MVLKDLCLLCVLSCVAVVLGKLDKQHNEKNSYMRKIGNQDGYEEDSFEDMFNHLEDDSEDGLLNDYNRDQHEHNLYSEFMYRKEDHHQPSSSQRLASPTSQRSASSTGQQSQSHGQWPASSPSLSANSPVSSAKYTEPILYYEFESDPEYQNPHEGDHDGYEGPHTGYDKYSDAMLASKPAKMDQEQYSPEHLENSPVSGKSGKGLHGTPTKEEIAQWQREFDDKQRAYLLKYKNKAGTKEEGRTYLTPMEDFSKAGGMNAEKFFYDHKVFNVSQRDIGWLDYRLTDGQGSVDYNTMSATPNGRHLLLISLFEDMDTPYWQPKCGGKLRLYLPDSLKDPQQPQPQKGGLVLKDIKSNGRMINRVELLGKMKDAPYGKIRKDQDLSRFNAAHNAAIASFISVVLSQETFDDAFSLMLTMRDHLNSRIFFDTVMAIIESRDDVGYVLPSLPTIQPFDYFPIASFKDAANKTEYIEEDEYMDGTHTRKRRQAIVQNALRRNQMNQGGPRGFGGPQMMGGLQGLRPQQQGPGTPPRPQVWRINWNNGEFRTLPASDPESLMWYFREDPLVSAHHLHWHLKMSNNRVPNWHPSHGLNMDRRGEMFYFMHKQMLVRFNADRLSLGLPLTTSLSRAELRRPMVPGYDSRLTQASGRPYPARPSGARVPEPEDLERAEDAIRQAIVVGQLTLPTGVTRLGYANGIDFGINALGNVMEAFEPSDIYGNLHNDGHEKIGRMHGDDETLGVMGNPNGAVRDPQFFRWHKRIDDNFQFYKNRLPPYGEEDLGFEGVHITAAHVQSERGAVSNNLHTFMDTTSTTLQSIDLQAAPGSSTTIVYDRLNHVPFTYHINVRASAATQGLLRIFLIPAGIQIPAHSDVTQVALEMDRFLITMNAGDNYFTRHSSRSPFISKNPMTLFELQNRLIQGSITEDEFNWSGCGWPEHLVLPRGRVGGMTFRLYFMISKILPRDSAMTSNWERVGRTSWSWCGVRRNEGDVPDSRPMGFPLDRKPPNGNWQSLMYRSDGVQRLNHFATDIVINHDRVGTTTNAMRVKK